MIRGKYLTSMDDTAEVFRLRRAVFGQEPVPDEGDAMAVYALSFDVSGAAVGTGRLHIDGDDRFRLDQVCVLEAARRAGQGDLLVRMLLQRALDLGAPNIHLTAPPAVLTFFSRYGFEDMGGGSMRATAESIDRAGGCSGHCAR